jgi:hypothetical protein
MKFSSRLLSFGLCSGWNELIAVSIESHRFPLKRHHPIDRNELHLPKIANQRVPHDEFDFAPFEGDWPANPEISSCNCKIRSSNCAL